MNEIEKMDNWRTHLLDLLHVDASGFSWFEMLIIVLVTLVAMGLVYKLARLILNRVVLRIVRATKAKWDDVLFDHNVLQRAIQIFPAMLGVVFLPFAFVGHTWAYDLVQRIAWVYVVGVFMATVVAALTALSHILHENESLRDKPVKGAIQMVQVIFVVLGIIVMISIIVNKSPAYLLTGIGVSATVLMLVFQDLILGLVAGIQLSANRMVRVGDWIVVSGKNIDGTVVEITLTTVKVRNWDYTISTIQPQALISGSFVNWSNMFESGGRRIARTINIDVHSVHFLTDEEVDKWKDDELLAQYIASTRRAIDEARSAGDEVKARSLRITNLGLFRIYLQNYITQLAAFNPDFVSMVRLMEPTANGVPMQIYFFVSKTAWVQYEGEQSALFEYIFSIVSEFDLRLFQSPTGDDIRSLPIAGSEKGDIGVIL